MFLPLFRPSRSSPRLDTWRRRANSKKCPKEELSSTWGPGSLPSTSFCSTICSSSLPRRGEAEEIDVGVWTNHRHTDQKANTAIINMHSPKRIMSSLEVRQICWLCFPPHKTLHVLLHCLLASSLLLPCLRWCVAGFVGALHPPVDYWNRVKLQAGLCIMIYSVSTRQQTHKKSAPKKLYKYLIIKVAMYDIIVPTWLKYIHLKKTTIW